MTATATAAFKPGNVIVTSFNSSSGVNGLLLPITVKASDWNQLMTSGTSQDGIKHDDYTVTFPTSSLKPPNNVTSGSDNVPEFTDAYGSKTLPGNFGLIDIGPDANDDPTFGTWIDQGPSSDDMKWLINNNRFPVSSLNPQQWKCGPGLKSNLVGNMANAIGEPRLIPLYSDSGGNGSNAYYNIVGFAGVTIVEATGNGSNIQVTLQPTAVIDPTAVTSTSTVQGTSNSLVYELSLTK